MSDNPNPFAGVFNSLSILATHMQEAHPDSENWGDSCMTGPDGQILFQKCFLCGKALIDLLPKAETK